MESRNTKGAEELEEVGETDAVRRMDPISGEHVPSLSALWMEHLNDHSLFLAEQRKAPHRRRRPRRHGGLCCEEDEVAVRPGCSRPMCSNDEMMTGRGGPVRGTKGT